MTDKKLERLWYVLHTKSRHESVVNDGLMKKSIEVYLPKVTVRSKRRDRKVTIRVPLFPRVSVRQNRSSSPTPIWKL